MKKNKGPIIALAGLLCVALLFAGVFFATRQGTTAGSKALTIEVVHGSGETKEFHIHTDAEYLGQALDEAAEIGVVGEDGPYGIYIRTVDGETCSDAEQTWWAVRQNGVDLMVGADQQPINDGEHYELVLSKW